MIITITLKLGVTQEIQSTVLESTTKETRLKMSQANLGSCYFDSNNRYNKRVWKDRNVLWLHQDLHVLDATKHIQIICFLELLRTYCYVCFHIVSATCCTKDIERQIIHNWRSLMTKQLMLICFQLYELWNSCLYYILKCYLQHVYSSNILITADTMSADTITTLLHQLSHSNGKQ